MTLDMLLSICLKFSLCAKSNLTFKKLGQHFKDYYFDLELGLFSWF